MPQHELPGELVKSDTAWRGAIHFHSRFSFDSVTSLRRLLNIARRERLDFLMLTDHDTTEGARALRDLAASRDLDIEVPIAAEYRTDHGDLIAAFIDDDIGARELDAFVAEVREKNGLILLPHPHLQHRDVERLVACADLVEVHNGRVGASRNLAAAASARAVGKPGYYASDAHLARHVRRVLVNVERRGSLRDSVAAGNVELARLESVGQSDRIVSQYIKAIRRRDLRLCASVSVGAGSALMRSLVSRHSVR